MMIMHINMYLFWELLVSYCYRQIDVTRLYHQSCAQVSEGHQKEIKNFRKSKGRLENMEKRRQIGLHTTKTFENRRPRRLKTIILLLTVVMETSLNYRYLHLEIQKVES